MKYKRELLISKDFTNLKFNNRLTCSSIFFFSPHVTVDSYKLVTSISTAHDDNAIHKNGKQELILKYNATKGAVYTLDQLCQSKICGRAMWKWLTGYFYN